LIKPRIRTWDQSGVQELVTITVPKRDVTQYTNNLSQNEVTSRLQVLAKTIDSRGWAIKGPNVNAYSPSGVIADQFSDRLVDASSLPQEVADNDVYASDDIMDAQNNPLAQHLDQMITSSSQTHRQAVLDKMDAARAPAATVEPAVGMPAPNYWFINQPDPAQMPGIAPTVDPGTLPALQTSSTDLSPEEKALLEQLHREQAQPPAPAYGHMRVIQPLSVQAQQQQAQKSPPVAVPARPLKPVVVAPIYAPKTVPAPVTASPSPAILELASNNDRDVASLAREANANAKKDEPDEVVIKLR
jgi:hypothetical protein